MKSPLSEAKSMGKQSSSPCWDSELFVLKDGGEAKTPTKNKHRSVVIIQGEQPKHWLISFDHYPGGKLGAIVDGIPVIERSGSPEGFKYCNGKLFCTVADIEKAMGHKLEEVRSSILWSIREHKNSSE